MSIIYQQTRRQIKTVHRRSKTSPVLLEDLSKIKAGTKIKTFEEVWETVTDETTPPPGKSTMVKQDEMAEVYTYVDSVSSTDQNAYYATTEYYDLVILDKENTLYHRLNLVK